MADALQDIATEAIRNMSLDKIPDFADNPKKCEKCSTVAYCLPEETRMLQEESARKGQCEY